MMAGTALGLVLDAPIQTPDVLMPVIDLYLK
jgi:hypothetical protein